MEPCIMSEFIEEIRTDIKEIKGGLLGNEFNPVGVIQRVGILELKLQAMQETDHLNKLQSTVINNLVAEVEVLKKARYRNIGIAVGSGAVISISVSIILFLLGGS